MRHTAAAKEVHKVLRANPVGSIGDTAPPFVLGTLLRLAYEAHVLSYVPGMMNTIVSNVPGPPMTLYMAGARLTGIFSASVLLDQMGLNITLFTFGDRVDFGVHVDPDLVEDPWVIADAIRDGARGAHGGRRARHADAGRGRVRYRFRCRPARRGQRVASRGGSASTAAMSSSRLVRKPAARSQMSGARSRQAMTAMVISPA